MTLLGSLHGALLISLLIYSPFTLTASESEDAEREAKRAAMVERGKAIRQRLEEAAKAEAQANTRYITTWEVTPGVQDCFAVTYNSYEDLRAAEIEKLNKQLIPASEQETHLRAIPEGGRFRIDIRTITIGHGNTDSFTYIIHNGNGNELVREKGQWNVPSSSGSGWFNIDLVSIQKPITTDAILLRIYDRITEKTSDFVAKAHRQALRNTPASK